MVELLLLLPIVFFVTLLGNHLLTNLSHAKYLDSERLLFSIVLGLGSLSQLIFVCGLLGHLRFVFPILIILSVILLVRYAFFGKIKHYASALGTQIVHLGYFSHLPLLLIGFSYAFYQLLNGLTPVINGDSLAAYLYVPKLFITSNSIGSLNWLNWDDLPLNIQMINLFGMQVYSDILSQLISGWFMGLICAVSVYTIARNFVSRSIALSTGIVFYTIPTISWLMYSAKIDLGYTMFELSFWALFIRWIKSKENRELFLSALFLGFAIGSKYHALFPLVIGAAIVVVELLASKVGIRKAFITLFIFCVIALAVGSPSYIKNFYYTGDPFYPFLTVPDTGAEEGINQYVGLKDYFRFQYHMFLNRDYLLVPRQMMCAPIGFIPLLFLPFVPFGFRKLAPSSQNRKVVLILFAYYIFLSFIIYKSVFPYPRHFLPAIGLLIAISSIGISYLHANINKRLVMVVLLISLFSTTFISNMGLLSYKSNMKTWKLQAAYLAGSISKDEYYNKRLLGSGILPNRGIIEYVNSMPSDTRIATLDYGTGYFLERPFIKRLYYYTISDIDSMKTELQKDRITHVYYSKKVLDDYVSRFNQGKHSLIYSYLKDNNAEAEYISGDQYLYRLNFKTK